MFGLWENLKEVQISVVFKVLVKFVIQKLLCMQYCVWGLEYLYELKY